MDNPIPKKALSINEAVASTGLGRTSLYKEIGSGRLKIVKVGGRTIIPVEEIDAWLKRLANGR